MNVFATIFSCAASEERNDLSSHHNVCALVRTLTCRQLLKKNSIYKITLDFKNTKSKMCFGTF